MAQPEICRALRRSYIETLTSRGSLKVSHLPTGVLVIENCETVGIATKNRGIRKPWRTKRMRLRVGSLLVPRVLRISNCKTVEIFTQLGIDSPPETVLYPYGDKGYLIAIYMYCEDIEHLSRMTEHILGEEGYGVHSMDVGEITDLFSLIDQIEILCSQIIAWESFDKNNRLSIDMQLIRLSTALEKKLDPNKVAAHKRLACGIRDRLKRVNPLIAEARSRLSQRKLNTRIHTIGDITPIIQVRGAFVKNHKTTLRRKQARFVNMIRLREKSYVDFTRTNKTRQQTNLAQSLRELAQEISDAFFVRPYRYRARLTAARLKRIADAIHDGRPPYLILNDFKTALKYFERINIE